MITDFIFSFSEYAFVKHFAIFLSYIYVYLLPVFILIWVFYSKVRKMYTFSILFLSSFFAWFLSQGIKLLFKIDRPETSGLIISESGFSFPSSHSSFSMVLGVVIYSINKKLGIVVITSSLLIGLSRIILGVHFTLDILFGWLLGIIVGLIFIRIFKKI